MPTPEELTLYPIRPELLRRLSHRGNGNLAPQIGSADAPPNCSTLSSLSLRADGNLLSTRPGGTRRSLRS